MLILNYTSLKNFEYLCTIALIHRPTALNDLIILKVVLQMLSNNNRYESVKGLYGLKKGNGSKGSPIVNISIS